MRPQARRARIVALVLSVIAVVFSIGFGIYIRRTITLFDRDDPQRYAQPFVDRARAAPHRAALPDGGLHLRALVARADVVEPPRGATQGGAGRQGDVGARRRPQLRARHLVGLEARSRDGGHRRLRAVRLTIPFRAPSRESSGMAAVIVAWVPGLNVYVAPFLWEMFATRIDRVCSEMLSAQNAPIATPAQGACSRARRRSTR